MILVGGGEQSGDGVEVGAGGRGDGGWAVGRDHWVGPSQKTGLAGSADLEVPARARLWTARAGSPSGECGGQPVTGRWVVCGVGAGACGVAVFSPCGCAVVVVAVGLGAAVAFVEVGFEVGFAVCVRVGVGLWVGLSAAAAQVADAMLMVAASVP
jgi:hypothetical protein